MDLTDYTPLFDLRIRAEHRSRGIGVRAVNWLTRYLFEELTDIRRVVGTTRQDNRAMRRVFQRCGYAQEAHYREAWPAMDGTVHDTVCYAILRRDWLRGEGDGPPNGTTEGWTTCRTSCLRPAPRTRPGHQLDLETVRVGEIAGAVLRTAAVGIAVRGRRRPAVGGGLGHQDVDLRRGSGVERPWLRPGRRRS